MRKSVSATIWSVLDRVWAQAIGLIIGIVLARLLTPSDYGLVGISMVFIAFSNVFIEAGFSNALIRKLDRTNTDYSTAFYINAVLGVVMYAILFLAAPWVADYFGDEQLIDLTRFVSLTVIFNSFCIVQNAILTADFKMRQQAVFNILSQIPSGLLAIYLAYKGAGVYALAVQNVLSSFIRTILFWWGTRWMPTWDFSMDSLKYLWGYGSRLVTANFLGTVFSEINTILIGKFVSKSDLGLFSKGRSLSTQPELICNGVVQKVAIPVLSQYQQDISILKGKYRELSKLIVLIMGFICGILIAIASPLINLLWGTKWDDAAPIFQLLVLSNLVTYVSYLSLVLLSVNGHTEYTLKLEFFKKPVYVVIIFILLNYGLYGLMIAQILCSVIGTFVNMSAPKKYISYLYREQLCDVMNYLSAVAIALLIAWGFACALDPKGLVQDIVMRTFIVTFVYVGVLSCLKDPVFMNVISFLKSKFISHIKLNL